MTEKRGLRTSSRMSGGDAAALRATVGSSRFTQAMKFGFSCGRHPVDIGLSFELATAYETLQQNVSGCIFPGTPGIAKGAHDLVTKY